MATHHLYVVAVETDSVHTADTVEERILGAVRASGLTPLPCGWAPDPDTVADGLDCPYDQIEIHDLNPAPADA